MVLLAALVLGSGVAHAQTDNQPAQDGTTAQTAPTPEELKDAMDGMGDRVTTLETDVDKLKSLKISGYVQADWQHYDQSSNQGRVVPGYVAPTNANGTNVATFPAKNLFTVRRGRVKIQSKLGDWMNAVIQPDITENGFALKEAYVELAPFSSPVLMITAGSQNRPNYEVEVSSSALEALERSQVTKAFYPNEYDLGLQLSTRYELFDGFDPKLQVGLFNGNGPSPETDSYKDIITRLTFPIPFGSESPVQADLGASFYYGGVPQLGDSVKKTVGETTVNVANDATGSLAGFGNKENFNIEAQIFLDILPIGGTIIKGEFMTGRRPTLNTVATSATVGTRKDSLGKDIVSITPGTSAGNLQIRNQSGFYAYFIQNVASDLQIVARYDMFDRNTDLAGTQVTSAGDAASSVLGVGANYFFGNMRFSVLYEMPTFAANENIQTDPATKKPGDDYRTMDLKDNKTTIRLQYKF
ncbi:MAG: Phosphate-selective porin [Chlorobi bacterium]|nr:Phosphate-selective porin [Chlorobiota bacterium]